jgi:hypothetical protein
MWAATQDLPRSAGHPFYAPLNQILDQHNFDGYVEELCERFYADDGRPGLPRGRYFLLMAVATEVDWHRWFVKGARDAHVNYSAATMWRFGGGMRF